MDIRHLALTGRLRAALRFVACDRRALLSELAKLRERIEVVTERYWFTRHAWEEAAKERDRWRERAAMLERVYDETRNRQKGRRRLPKAVPSFRLGQVLEGPVTGIGTNGIYVELDEVDWLVAIPELSWGDVRHAVEMIAEGEYAKVKVLSTPAHSEHPYLVLV